MTIPLTSKQKAIIVGNLLGDGGIYCRKHTSTKNSHYYIKQSLRYKDYIFWLFNELENICPSSSKQRKDNSQWYFYSKYLENLTDLRKTFYREKKKVIPVNIGELLTSSISIAVWYMDDGTLDWRPKDHYAFLLTTHCFSVRDNYRLIDVLRKNFRVNATVQTTLIRGKRYPRIYIGAKGRDRFLQIVKPHILNCFSHKLPPKYHIS